MRDARVAVARPAVRRDGDEVAAGITLHDEAADRGDLVHPARVEQPRALLPDVLADAHDQPPELVDRKVVFAVLFALRPSVGRNPRWEGRFRPP